MNAYLSGLGGTTDVESMQKRLRTSIAELYGKVPPVAEHDAARARGLIDGVNKVARASKVALGAVYAQADEEDQLIRDIAQQQIRRLDSVVPVALAKYKATLDLAKGKTVVFPDAKFRDALVQALRYSDQALTAVLGLGAFKRLWDGWGAGPFSVLEPIGEALSALAAALRFVASATTGILRLIPILLIAATGYVGYQVFVKD